MVHTSKNTFLIPQHPARLYHGDAHTTMNTCIDYLIKQLCPNEQCKVCQTCNAIREQKHPHLLWINGSEGYTKDTIDEIHIQTRFSRCAMDPLYIVLERVDLMHNTAAHALLKILEEPPAHHFFILLSNHLEKILNTITSRCIIINLQTEQETPVAHWLYQALTNHSVELQSFHMHLEKEPLTPHDTLYILEKVMFFWYQTYQKHRTEENNSTMNLAYKKWNIVQHYIEKPIMPGSSKIILRSLALQLMF